MKRHAKWMAVLTLGVFAVLLSACDFGGLVIRIHDFDSKDVLGVTVWSMAPGSDAQRQVEVEFFEPEFDPEGNEVLYYRYTSAAGSGESANALRRSPGDADEVTLVLWNLPLETGKEYKLSAFNSAGDSTLSSQSYVPKDPPAQS